MSTESSTNTCAWITTNQPETKYSPNPYPATKQHAVVSIQLNVVTCHTCPVKFIRDDVITPFLLLSVVIVTLPRM